MQTKVIITLKLLFIPDRKVIVFFILFYCKSLFAQQNEDALVKRFEFKAGVDITNMNFNKGFPMPTVASGAKWKTGVTAGFSIHIPLFEHLFLQPEYLYTQRKGFDLSTGENYKANYFTFPVLLRYQLSPLFSLIAGPQAELLVNAKAGKNEVSSDITHNFEERSIALTGGISLRLKKPFILSARYTDGLNHIGIGQRSESIKEFKYQVVNLMAGIEF